MADKSIIEYRDIIGFTGYRVGNDGSVWSCRRSINGRGTGTEWHQLSPGKTSGGGLFVQLGRGNYRRVARLVLEAFVGPCPAGMECCHYPDRNPKNCDVNNLRWDTSAANTEDQRKHGTLIGGERHGMAKLSNAQVEHIKSLAGTMPQWRIGQQFGIKQPHVSDILNAKKRTASSHAGRGLL